MKRWLVTYGTCVLDNLLPITDPKYKQPFERYCNLSEVIDSHFNLRAFYQTQVEPTLPLILVSFEDISDNACIKTYEITFDVYFQTISPHDCKDNEVTIINSPEAILAYVYHVNEALSCMIRNMDSDLRGFEFEEGVWEYPIDYTLVSDIPGTLEGISSDEILHFTHTFVVQDNVSCC